MNEKEIFFRNLKLRIYTILFMINGFTAYFLQLYKQLVRMFLGKSINYEIPYDLSGWVALVTGGSGEIGLSCVKRLLKQNCHVIIATIPNPGQTMDELKQQLEDDLRKFKRNQWELHHVNLSSFASINQFVNDFKKTNRQIDLLINNAAVFLVEFGITEDGFERHLEVNYLGHCLLTLNLLPCLRPSKSTLKYRKKMNLGLKSKVVNISSYSHHWINADLSQLDYIDKDHKESYSRQFAYSYSKLLIIAFNFYLSKMLYDSKKFPSIINMHPGGVGSKMIFDSCINDIMPVAKYESTFRALLWDSNVGANFVMQGAFSRHHTEKEVYLEFYEPVKPNAICCDTEFQKKVFEKTIGLLGEHLNPKILEEVRLNKLIAA